MSYKIAILSLIAVQAYCTYALPPCTCTRNLQPVCGSDGETYSNACILECQRHNGKADLVIVKDGPCVPDTPVCICTYEYKPVCGTDGQSYPNRCALNCERSKIPNLDVVSDGECQPKTTEPPCVCPDNLDPVCGTDGNTYDNACILNCQTGKNSKLSVKHQGKCDDRVKVVNPLQSDQPQCACPRNLKPVCGSDGVTYNNECLMRCAGAQPNLARHGAC